MFEVSVEQTFAAAHALRNYHGKCENLHGHNYRVQATFRGAELDGAGMLVDFVEVKRHMRAVTERLDHINLNETAPFDVINPSAENIARYVFEQMRAGMAAERGKLLREVKVWETDIQYAAYRPHEG
ncbi:MAG TPA: 6-carboxytetrahydropterin synthase QueD [Solibacterales bacterium]|jgi:6-pyruvoyltetrahydropterin/6-carboxytetrahydropterin synthase|nr:6-carboxytetrahydropterin synthase QueD [Bryobacterales bacterium]